MAHRAQDQPQSPTSQPVAPSEIRNYIAIENATFAEYADLCRNPCDGMFLITSENNPCHWQGVLAVIEGPYDGAMLRFTLSFSPFISFLVRPRLVFALPIFHPLVDPKSGEFDLEYLYPQWSKNIRMRELLVRVRDSFALVDGRGMRNTEAASLYLSSPKDYRTRVSMDIIDSMRDLTNENAVMSNTQMNFGPWIAELHEPILKDIIATGAVIIEKKNLAAAKAGQSSS